MKMIHDIHVDWMRSAYSCVFEHNGKQYFADLCVNMFYDSECMIFAWDAETDQVSDWKDLYCKRDILLTAEQLMSCVEDFCSNEE